MKDAQRLVDRPEQSTADRIAEVLKETEERPLWQLRMVVKCLGSDKALELLTETEQIEQQGGMLVPDGSRRRTPGGVFFALARKKLPKGDRLRIFGLPGGRPQKPRATAEAAPASETRPLVAVSPRTRRRLVEVSTIAQYRAPGPFRPGVKSPPPHPLPHAKPLQTRTLQQARPWFWAEEATSLRCSTAAAGC